MPDVEVTLTRLEERHEALERRLEEHERRQNGAMDRIAEELAKIHTRIDGRPSWAVTLLMTGLCSLVVGLSVALVKGGGT